MTVHACTIVACNYLPAARVLAKSFHEHHEQGTFTTLVIDDLFGLVDPHAEPFQVIDVTELGIERPELLRMQACYDVTELSTALKPWLLEYVVDLFGAGAIYIDPDIKLFASLEEVSELASQYGIVLTPHETVQMTRDDRTVSESSILGSGIYNLGFIAIDHKQDTFLDFWQERLKRECVVDPKHMRFVDQRWVDFVPGLFCTHILRNPAYNLAYWNLDHRDVVWTGDQCTVDGEPLRFFHFSGYSPRAPHLLSKHQGAHPRILLLSDHPAIVRLCEGYRQVLVENGYEENVECEYGYGRTLDGFFLDGEMRRLYRESLQRAENVGLEPPPNPFATEGQEAFIAWLNEPVGLARPHSVLSRYLCALHASRSDLCSAFPDPGGVDHERFLDWSRHEANAARIDHRLAFSTIARQENGGQPQNARGSRTNNGELLIRDREIRVVGAPAEATRAGALTRLVCSMLDLGHVPYSTFIDPLHFRGETRSSVTNVVCLEARVLADMAVNASPKDYLGRHNIVVVTSDAAHCTPEFVESLDWADEIWTASGSARSAMLGVLDKPTFVLPFPIVASTTFASGNYVVPERFVFLSCVDLTAAAPEESPLGIIEAFSRAFAADEGPILIVKVVNGEFDPSELEALRFAASSRPDIDVDCDYIDAWGQDALLEVCDCYVSLHGGDDFNPILVRALELSKPVITLEGSGELELVNGKSGFVAPPPLTGETPKYRPYRQGTGAPPIDIGVITRMMREVVYDPLESAVIGERGRDYVVDRSLAVTEMGFVVERLAIADQTPMKGVKMVSTAADEMTNPTVVDSPSLVALALKGPPLDVPSRHRRITRFVRQIATRILRPQVQFQNEINLALANDVEHLTGILAALRGLEGRITGLEAIVVDLEAHIEVSRSDLAREIGGIKSILIGLGDRARANDRLTSTIELGLRELQENIDPGRGRRDEHSSAV